MPIVSAAAWTGLIDKAKLRAGQQVFITGCLGAVGRVAETVREKIARKRILASPVGGERAFNHRRLLVQCQFD